MSDCEKCGARRRRHEWCEHCTQRLCELCMVGGCCGAAPAVSGRDRCTEDMSQYEAEEAP